MAFAKLQGTDVVTVDLATVKRPLTLVLRRKRGMVARSVVVVMPFGGKDRTERRRAILNFKRLEYLVRNKCNVTSASLTGEADQVTYVVEVAKTEIDDIGKVAL